MCYMFYSSPKKDVSAPLAIKIFQCFPWSCSLWETALHREASMCVPVKSLVCLMLALLWRCVLPTQAWVSNRELRGEAGLREQTELFVSSLWGLWMAKKSVTWLFSVFLCRVQKSDVEETRSCNRYWVNSCLHPLCLANFKAAKLLSLHLQASFPELSRIIFTCKFKRRAGLIWEGGHAA